MPGEDTIVTNINNLDATDLKKPYLTFIKGPLLGQIHEIVEEATYVGRASECNLWIEDSAISRKHFKVSINNGELEIEDLKSTNGTYVNGDRITKAALHDGDKIQISQDILMEVTYLDSSRVQSERVRYEMGVKDPVPTHLTKGIF